jgi:hypothetical protein
VRIAEADYRTVGASGCGAKLRKTCMGITSAPPAYISLRFIKAKEHTGGHPRYNYSITKYEAQEREAIGAFKN